MFTCCERTKVTSFGVSEEERVKYDFQRGISSAARML
jgi:hypothetical protein